ncbi:HNH endonuclease signature motif containing protein [Gordonia insulae]|uniref:HNH domain-containing protein n=1 Tax=Gordonia insulae TaxID=2420509 RepID=A0A3G8JUE2_9ACTN|nr:HNH endonuclease signature motif containing protein [Gordonia insulae]AZG48488.1 hypothetical protein D7316_05105 [Gordonia insulae]
MTTVSDLPTLTDTLRDLTIDDDLSGRDAFNAMRTILTLRNLIDHHAAHLVATLDRLGVATTHGRKTRELLIVMGYAPAVAARLIRIAGSTTTLPTLHAHAADGAIPAEHIDAITTGITHIATRSPQPVDSEARYTQVSDLLGHYFSGATPAQIAHRAKQLGNDLAATTAGGLPAGQDRTLNTLTHHEDHGRLHIRADRSHDHHIQHWAHNGTTVLDNGCLLCPSCHADIHHNGWDVIIGTDNHPWLIPPATVDPQRTPLPAYNRRTLTLDNLPTAA